MGTRNLTIVKMDGKTRIAQYGQWDGYPTGQGQEIADFLTDVNLKKFKEKLNELKEVDEKEVEKFLESLGSKDGWMNSEQSAKLHKRYPGIDRDRGAGILQLIYDGEVTEVRLSEDFKNDSLFCEYFYTFNLDKETVQVNKSKEYTFDEWKKKGFMQELENLM